MYALLSEGGSDPSNPPARSATEKQGKKIYSEYFE